MSSCRLTASCRISSPGDLDAPARVVSWSLDQARQAVDRAPGRLSPPWAAPATEARLALLRRLAERFTAHREAFARLLGIEVGKPLWEGAEEAKLLGGESRLDARPRAAAGRDPSAPWRRRRVALSPPRPAGGPRPLQLPGASSERPHRSRPRDWQHRRLQTLRADACHRRALRPVLRRGRLSRARVPGRVRRAHGGSVPGGARPTSTACCCTGSTEVGAAIARANADKPGKLLALELGGKNAALVFADADLDRAAYQIAYGAYLTAGQRCSSTSRCLVERERRGSHADQARRAGARPDRWPLRGPAGLHWSAHQRSGKGAHSRRRCADARRGRQSMPPGEVVVPGKRGHYLRPSLHRVAARKAGNRYQENELFGPDIALYAFEDEGHGLNLANDTTYGLCASVFTSDRARFDRLARAVRAGVINWNSPTVGVPAGKAALRRHREAPEITGRPASSAVCTAPGPLQCPSRPERPDPRSTPVPGL